MNTDGCIEAVKLIFTIEEDFFILSALKTAAIHVNEPNSFLNKPIMSTFKELQVIQPILKALEEKKYINPTPVQQATIPYILEKKDILGCAQTGTGKTAAFAIPILQLIHNTNNAARKKIRALILAPTRELASQIADNIADYGKYTTCRHTVIYGGVPQAKQVKALTSGVDIVIATPGRLKDLITQGYVDLSYVELLVLDEADRMLDMGFIHDIKFIQSKIPQKKQSVFFTATLSDSIKKLAGNILSSPVHVNIKPAESTANRIEQFVYFVEKQNKKKLLFHLFESKELSNVLIFTKTKHGADRLSSDLNKIGIKADALHGGKSQNARNRSLAGFRSGKNNALVVTDIAARGIDIEKLALVINYDIPNESETYVHRIGRTGRAGESGHAISFCDTDELSYFNKISKLTNDAITTVDNHPFSAKHAAPVSPTREIPQEKSKRNENDWLRNRRISGIYNSFKRRLS